MNAPADRPTPKGERLWLESFIDSTTRHERSELFDRWRVEIEKFEPEDRDFEVAECAELAEELDLYRVMAEEDENFDDEYGEWSLFILERELWLALEQCCGDGGLLVPMDQRALRVRTCPEELLRSLRWFFELCPAHVKHYLALEHYLIVRSERARRTGSPEWRPETGSSRDPMENTVFFRPPRPVVRKYGPAD